MLHVDRFIEDRNPTFDIEFGFGGVEIDFRVQVGKMAAPWGATWNVQLAGRTTGRYLPFLLLPWLSRRSKVRKKT